MIHVNEEIESTKDKKKETATTTPEWTGVTFKDGTYRAYITGPISEKEKWYYPLLEALYNATDKDTVHILINSGGGSVDASNAIMHAIGTSKAKINIDITGSCASAAAQIFFFAMKLERTDYRVSMLSRILIHPFTGGVCQRFDALKERVDGMLEWQERNFRTIYEDILTEEEIQSILKGKEFYLNPEDAISRIQAFHEALNQQKEKKQQEIDEHRRDLEELTKAAFAVFLAEKKAKAKAKTNVTRKTKEAKDENR